MPQKEARHQSHEMASSPSTPLDEQNGDATNRSPAQLQPAPSETYLSGFKFGITLFALLIAVFCVALDSTIISTAIPRITDEFHNLHDVGWYGSGTFICNAVLSCFVGISLSVETTAYLLTKCAFQLPFGKVFRIFSLKWSFLTALLLFEVGSIVCAAAPSSTALIVGVSSGSSL